MKRCTKVFAKSLKMFWQRKTTKRTMWSQDGSMWKRTFSSSSRSSGFMRLRRALPGATRRKAGKPKWIKKKSIDGGSHNDFTIPMPLKLEHQKFHANLVKATKAGGPIGDAAQGGCQSSSRALREKGAGRASAAWVAIHLGAAPSRRGIKKVLTISDRLKAELPKMLEEHESVVTALKVDM